MWLLLAVVHSLMMCSTLPSSPAAAHAAAVAHLTSNRNPSRDQTVDLSLQATLALRARLSSRWASEDVPWRIFCESVLPYACLDEPRCDCSLRQRLFDRFMPIVADADDALEAASRLNTHVWESLGVVFQPNLSPALLAPVDVVAAGRASCTGLSLLLVACCRAVGVPARVVGVLDWGDAFGGGNHVWVEIHSRGAWHYVGAAEPSPFNSTWFDERVRAPDGPRVFASAFQRPDGAEDAPTFPLPWATDQADNDVPAIDVTSRYRAHGAEG